MNTLKQFQEEGELMKYMDERYPNVERWKYEIYAKSFLVYLSKQTTLAYELGKKEVYSDNGANDMCEYWHKKGKKEMLEMVEQKAVKICNGDDDCIDNFTEIWEEIKKEITSS